MPPGPVAIGRPLPAASTRDGELIPTTSAPRNWRNGHCPSAKHTTRETYVMLTSALLAKHDFVGALHTARRLYATDTTNESHTALLAGSGARDGRLRRCVALLKRTVERGGKTVDRSATRPLVRGHRAVKAERRRFSNNGPFRAASRATFRIERLRLVSTIDSASYTCARGITSEPRLRRSIEALAALTGRLSSAWRFGSPLRCEASVVGGGRLWLSGDCRPARSCDVTAR